MGSYREIKGDLLDLLDLFDQGEFEAIAHGANCQGGLFNAGIAAQIKERYPMAYYADVFDTRNDIDKLGGYTCTPEGDIYNLYTQLYPGKHAKSAAISLSLCKMRLNLITGTKIGLPLIGCGIGGLKWKDVNLIVQEELKNFNVTVVIWDKS